MIPHTDGRRARPAREDKDDGDADGKSYVSEGGGAWRNAGGRSREERGVMAGLGSFRRGFI